MGIKDEVGPCQSVKLPVRSSEMRAAVVAESMNESRIGMDQLV